MPESTGSLQGSDKSSWLPLQSLAASSHCCTGAANPDPNPNPILIPEMCGNPAEPCPPQRSCVSGKGAGEYLQLALQKTFA